MSKLIKDIQPSDDYDELRKQFVSMRNSAMVKAELLNHYYRNNHELEKEKLLVSQEVLDGERDMNDKLTNQLVDAEKRIAELEQELSDWKGRGL